MPRCRPMRSISAKSRSRARSGRWHRPRPGSRRRRSSALHAPSSPRLREGKGRASRPCRFRASAALRAWSPTSPRNAGRTMQDGESTTGGERPMRAEGEDRSACVLRRLPFVVLPYLRARRATAQQYGVTGLPRPAIPALAWGPGQSRPDNRQVWGDYSAGLADDARRAEFGTRPRADSTGRCPGRIREADRMPITLLDIILIGVMLISALLAMIRGFMREVLSIAAWVIAALVTLYLYNKLLPVAKTYFNNDIIAAAAVVGGTFLGTLLIVSIITVRFSDMVLDSRVGALDRTLGFLFGLARGLIIVVVAFLFFAWLVPDRSQPEWIRSAKSRIVLQGTGDWLMSMLPDDPESTILKKLKKPKLEEDEAAPTPGQRSGLDTPTEPGGYASSDRSGMQQLIRGKPVAR